MIDWSKGTKTEIMLCSRIAKLAVNIAGFGKVSQLVMSLQACHTHGCALRLKELITARPSDLMHDVFGIHSNINKNNGKLENCFVPRFAVNQ